jgi:hypothetical protein
MFRIAITFALGLLLLQGAPSCAQSNTQSLTFTPGSRKVVIEEVARHLADLYVSEEIGKRYSQQLKQQLEAGAYESISSPTVLADSLQALLMRVYEDRHLRIRYDPLFHLALQEGGLQRRQEQAADEEQTYGFVKSEVLKDNIGYLKFNQFTQPTPAARKAADKHLSKLANVSALIVDLRDNGGGSPDMVQYISSYLFDSSVHLNSLYERPTNRTIDFWTEPRTEPSTLSKVPIYVLTSKYTFSGAEEFSYNLQNLKRATIIGEVTKGGAHPTRPFPLSSGFVVFVPFAKAVNPITKSNWEAVGIQPHIKVPAAQALEQALSLAQKAAAPKAF